jgi:hypothetical protein
MPYKRLALIFFLAVESICNGQKNQAQTASLKPEKYLSVEPIWSWGVDNEISANIGRVDHHFLDEYPISSKGPFIGAGVRFVENDSRFFSRVGYAYYYGFFGARAQVCHYTNFSEQQFVFRPELGVSLLSWINLLYGYNFSLASQNQLMIQGHSLSLSIHMSSYFTD